MTSTTTMIMMFSIMLAMNVGLVMVQGGMSEANPAGPEWFNVSSSPYANYVDGDTLVVDDSLIPSDETVQEDTAGNFFTDAFSNLRSWMQKKLSPINFVANILRQPYGFLKDTGVPTPVALAIGVFWYMIALIIIVSWWMGR